MYCEISLSFIRQSSMEYKNIMAKLVYRSRRASDGRQFALLTDQENVEEAFDSGFKVAYKNHGQDSILKREWGRQMICESSDFDMMDDTGTVPNELMETFNSVVSNLIKGIDVFFCDYNLGIKGDAPMCNDIMNTYRSTDFVLFSCSSIIQHDPQNQPYFVSYAMPRYDVGAQQAQQHRIYCKTDHFAFSQAISTILVQRNKDELSGGIIREDLEPYIVDKLINKNDATNELERFVTMIKRLNQSDINHPEIKQPDIMHIQH